MWENNDFENSETWVLLQSIPASDLANMNMYQNLMTGVIKCVTVLLDDRGEN